MNRPKEYKTGIYFLLQGFVVVYIGQTARFPHRLVYHKQQCLPFDSVRFFECQPCHLNHYEQRWIKLFKPAHNTTYKPKEIKVKKALITLPKYKRRMKFRKLSRLSRIGFGNYSDRTVEHMLGTGRLLDLVSMYYKLSHISFLDEVLIDLGIVNEWVIEKPGVNRERYYDFSHTFYPSDVASRKENALRREYKISKASLKAMASKDGSKAYHRSFNQKA